MEVSGLSRGKEVFCSCPKKDCPMRKVLLLAAALTYHAPLGGEALKAPASPPAPFVDSVPQR